MKSFDLNSFKAVLPVSVLAVATKAKATAATPQKKTKKKRLHAAKEMFGCCDM